ncbi:MAG: TatD family hydrolase [Holophagales bacterium]|jgi:TatD DNase family protein|nr:TatD family hydrolase [Holophagales bacterium]
MLLDAHCHLTGNYQKDMDVESVLRRAQIAGVHGMIAVGTDLEDSGNVLKLAESHDNIRASLGVHPHDAKLWDPDTEQALTELLQSPKALFVGETGLDWHYDLSPRERQEPAFRAQIRLAKKLNKPLMIHTRSAPDATLRVLEEEDAARVGGIIHCFTENLAFAKRAVELNFYISFSGILTFPKKCEAIRETAVWAPEDRILVETDSPFLAPIPYRGKPCEPAFVTHTAKCLAELRGRDAKHIHRVIADNMETLCGWRP